eukprot:snap_masked-scaffold_20-processed-gene-5.87-mRNA-1 protein AED:0.37 eAED:0.39 QI:0/-1/0/1/-1/1/1/0/108
MSDASKAELKKRIEYSDKYYDGEYEYRHVILPKELAKALDKDCKLLSEEDWRNLGVQQSRGWQHYAVHRPEPHVLLFRRPHGTDPVTGEVDQNKAMAQKDLYKRGVLV